MKYLTLLALVTLATSHPANLTTRSNGACEFHFTPDACSTKHKNSAYCYKPSLKDGTKFTPNPELPPDVGPVSHCYDFVDPDYEGKYSPIYNPDGRTNYDFDPRPFKFFPPDKGNMWMLDDSCKDQYAAIAVFESQGCQGSYVWYSLNAMQAKKHELVLHDKTDWCARPFERLSRKIASIQMWEKAPPGAFGTVLIMGGKKTAVISD
jgi:hypothetical protein